MHKHILLGIMLLLSVFLLMPPGSAQDIEEIPEEIEIENEGYRRKLYEPVYFTHLEHVDDIGLDCTDCHHNYQDGENVWEEGDPVKKCVVCHHPRKKQGDVYRLVFAYHFSCKKCHKEYEAGPVACEDCHTKI